MVAVLMPVELGKFEFEFDQNAYFTHYFHYINGSLTGKQLRAILLYCHHRGWHRYCLGFGKNKRKKSHQRLEQFGVAIRE